MLLLAGYFTNYACYFVEQGFRFILSLAVSKFVEALMMLYVEMRFDDMGEKVWMLMTEKVFRTLEYLSLR